MNSKKEKFESLRLELQEFTPQEYCDTCWIWELECTNEGTNLYHSGSGNNPYTHGRNHKVTLTAKDDSEKAEKTSLIHFVEGRYGPKHNSTTSGTLWYYQTESNGYHIYGGETWQPTNHS